MKNLLLMALAFTALNLNANNISLKAVVQSPACHGAATGSIDLVIDGGTAPFTFLWSNGSTTSSLSNIVAGTYSVTVNDNGGLISSTTIIIAEPNILSVTGFVINVSQTGGNDGSITLTPRGGTQDYTYAWDNSATSKDISNLTVGNYTVVVTDGHGCQTSLTKTVQGPIVPMFFGPSTNNHMESSPHGDSRSKDITNNYNKVSIYPNPASDFLEARFQSATESQISVININGQIVAEQKFNNENPKLDVSNLNNGNYIVQVKTATSTTNKNIVIVK